MCVCVCVCVCVRACVRFAYSSLLLLQACCFRCFGAVQMTTLAQICDLKVFDSESAERISSGNEFHSTM